MDCLDQEQWIFFLDFGNITSHHQNGYCQQRQRQRQVLLGEDNTWAEKAKRLDNPGTFLLETTGDMVMEVAIVVEEGWMWTGAGNSST